MSDSPARKKSPEHLAISLRGSAERARGIQEARKLAERRDQSYQRLKRLYEISRRVASFENVDETFPAILTLVAEVFPLISAVLIEKRKEGRIPRRGLAHLRAERESC